MNELSGQMTAVEKETRPGSRRSHQQNEDLQAGADRLGLDFELDLVDEDDTWP